MLEIRQSRSKAEAKKCMREYAKAWKHGVTDKFDTESYTPSDGTRVVLQTWSTNAFKTPGGLLSDATAECAEATNIGYKHWVRSTDNNNISTS